MQRLALVVVSLVVIGGCHQDNPQSCELPSNAGNGVCPGIDAAIDAPPPPPECSMTIPCANPDKGVCDTTINGGTCVQCTATSATACKDTTPVCINDVCVPCTRHADCVDSNVCKPDGKCANKDDVAYVDGAGTDQMMCTKALPCTKIENAAMVKDLVKIKGMVTERATLKDRHNLMILAEDDAKLIPAQNGPALDIQGDSTIVIYDLDVSHTAGDNSRTGIAVSDTAQVELIRVSLLSNPGDGAQIANGAKLTCTRCTIAQNTGRGIFMSNGDLTISRSEIKANGGGGIFVPADGKFQIVGNIIFGNGGGSSQAGGIHIGASPGDGTSRIDFNSISRNTANAAFAPGIDCVSTGIQITAKFNVVWDNGVSPFSSNQVNVAGCAHVSSDIGPLPNPPASTNFNSDPGFRDEATGDLHLKSDSSVLQKAPAPDLTGLAAVDIDGDTRVTPVDLGADQLTRP